MSTDTIALFQTPDAKQAVEAIFKCALTMPDALCRVSERFGTLWQPKEWKYEEGKFTDAYAGEHLLGPGGFSISSEGQIVQVWHVLRFSSFAFQEEDGRIVLDAFHFIGQVIGSAEMIVTHEILPWDGDDLDTIATNLTNTIGLPATNWTELFKAEHFSTHCWMRVSIPTAD